MAADRRIVKAIMGFKTEDTKGTFIEPACGAYVYNLTVPSITPNFLETRSANGSMTNTKNGNVIAEQEVSCTFDIPVQNIISTSYLVNYSNLFSAAGMTCSLVVSDNIVTASEVSTTISFTYNVEGQEYKVRGAVADATLTLNASENAMWSFEVKGFLESVVTESAITVTGTEFDFWVVEGCTTSTIGSGTSCVDKVGIKLNNTSTAVKCGTADRGASHFVNTSRKPTGDFKGVELNGLSLYTAGTTADYNFVIASETHTLTLSAKGVVSAITPSGTDGLQKEDITTTLLADSGSELTLTSAAIEE